MNRARERGGKPAPLPAPSLESYRKGLGVDIGVDAAGGESGKLRAERLIGERINLEEARPALMAMDKFPSLGVSAVNWF